MADLIHFLVFCLIFWTLIDSYSKFVKANDFSEEKIFLDKCSKFLNNEDLIEWYNSYNDYLGDFPIIMIWEKNTGKILDLIESKDKLWLYDNLFV